MIDPNKQLYTVLVKDSALDRVRPRDPSVRGPYSNPGIGRYGPLRSESE